ncbi:MAG: hypothetical protein OXD01_02665 [Gammaproteobacteria bacterium]|nr:hypothetical protein [Gammaproteobacteria bacterium]
MNKRKGKSLTFALGKSPKFMQRQHAYVRAVAAVIFLTGVTLSPLSQTQEGALQANYPELAQLANAHDVTQAKLFDAISEINSDPATMDVRKEVRMQVDMMNNMDMHDHMAMGHGGSEMTMDISGPYGELEIQIRVKLYNLLRDEHSQEVAQTAIENVYSLPEHAWRVLSWGRQFERKLYDIYADSATSRREKQESVAAAIAVYQAEDPRHAVSLVPKNADLYLAHPYANAAKTAFPRLSSLLWTNQWLQLAALEAIVVGQLDPQFSGKVPVTLERYWNKVGSDTGMTMFPLPVEMPSMPAIAPSLFSEVPQAAVIIDNLNMLEAAIVDIIAYPDLDDRNVLLESVAEEFTSSSENVSDEMTYLLSALRGGIFNQGGPAIGELTGSERNRSRSAMNMNHSMIMAGPQ